MTEVLWHWAITNPGPGKLLVWLEPWAEEFEVSSRSTIALSFHPGDANFHVDLTADRIVVWANTGQTARVFIDGVVQDSFSASAPVPDGLDENAKKILTLLFDEMPGARLRGKNNQLQRRPSMWRRIKTYLKL